METAVQIATLINSVVSILFFIVLIILIFKIMKIIKLFTKMTLQIKRITTVLENFGDGIRARINIIEDTIDEIILMIRNLKDALKKGISGLISRFIH
ncbi:MAG TPA: hypothetical protein DHW82_06210 [Spirochaetia bacterium]|nr:MAG: hypothetical protein A2Y41_01290 [Spirochaetes bacterium GWB1_36_13]HCL56586.1 hypothetical protein [Spirochaetia bacterium]